MAIPMKAARFTRYGSASQVVVVDELSRPEPGAHDVLVPNHASSINFDNMAHIRGKPFVVRLMMGIAEPRKTIPGDRADLHARSDR